MNEVLNTFLNGFIQLLLPICATILTALAALIGSKINSYMKSKNLEVVTNYVVKYTEQVYKDMLGADKLEKAMIMATLLLKEKGITVSEKELTVMIEKACYELKVNLTK